MKTSIWMSSLGLCLLVGCATPELKLDPTLKTFSREDLEEMDEIVLPYGNRTDNFRKLQMGVSFDTIGGVDKKTGQPLTIDPNLCTRLQTEMAKLKRFTIFSAHNRGGVMFFQDLADVDSDVSLVEAEDVRNIDLILSGKITVRKERQDRYNDTVIIYEVECDFSCEDLKTRTVMFAEKATGRTARKVLLSFSGRKMAGFDDSDEQQAIAQATMKALAVVANKLGNAFPVGAEVTGISSSGNQMVIPIGVEEGIGNKHQCAIYVDDGGVPVPIALAEAAPGANKSSLMVYKWNKRNVDAKPFIRALQDAPRQFLKNNKVYAVGYGLSVPPEWENAYEGSMDEQLRLK